MGQTHISRRAVFENLEDADTPPRSLPVYALIVTLILLMLAVLGAMPDGLNEGLTASVAQRVWLVLGAPVTEEVLLRAGLHDWLLQRWSRRRGGALLANVLSALVFAAAHAAMRPGWPAVLTLLPALLVGLVYQQSRRLPPCIALHASFNAFWLLAAPLAGFADLSFPPLR